MNIIDFVLQLLFKISNLLCCDSQIENKNTKFKKVTWNSMYPYNYCPKCKSPIKND